MPYQNTQLGLVAVGILGAAAVVIWRLTGNAPMEAILVPFVILAAMAIVFSSLTVAVTATGLEWWLGFGLLKRSIRFEEISAARARRIFPLAFGIHWDLRGGVSYIVNGGAAVELFIKNGNS